jgi:isoaspartyl peptidase/L-asparaginase-like protein (Ntn-hydrolase superfamily)
MAEAGRRGCLTAARLGYALLESGSGAVDAVVRAVAALEDDPTFNAARGAVLTSAGSAELDACVMRGEDRRAGAVACVTRTRNPVLAARGVMDTSHVLLVGSAADAFARELGLEQVEPEYFVTERQRQRLEQRLADALEAGGGTVGAVAVDRNGRVAAATSTGGTIGKLPGRVGDTPMIGAGTYASQFGAASGTGDGEVFMRGLATYVAVRSCPVLGAMVAAEAGLAAATELGGTGGLILVSPEGEIGFAFNTPAMARAWVRDGEEQSAA